jgi:phospholipid-binding lipoprotein MlaA
MMTRTGRRQASDRRREGRALTATALLCLAAIGLLANPAPARAATYPSVAAANTSSVPTVEDPFEALNRRGYAINRAIDRAVLRPLALGYAHGTPGFLQKALHNLIVLLSEPVVFGNDVLQLRIARAAGTFTRFATNATVGIGGLFDPATKWGIPHHNNGFGTTLGRYGVKPGPYVFVPLLGPSNFRDLIGQAVDLYSDPINQVHYQGRKDVTAGVWVVGGIDQRANAEADLEQIEQMGTDPYATMRSLFMQNREAEIHPGRGVDIENLPSFDETPSAPAPAAPPAAQPGTTSPSAQASPPPAATDPSVAAPSSAIVAAAPAGEGGDEGYFVTAPEARMRAAARGGPPPEL